MIAKGSAINATSDHNSTPGESTTHLLWTWIPTSSVVPAALRYVRYIGNL
jgi:hypothetical protein